MLSRVFLRDIKFKWKKTKFYQTQTVYVWNSTILAERECVVRLKGWDEEKKNKLARIVAPFCCAKL